MSMPAEGGQSVVAEMRSVIRSLCAAPAEDVAHALELGPLLEQTDARAVGCWRHEAGALHLAGFLAVDDMPARVQAEFVAATRRADLSQTQFGIVQAVTRGGPAVNHRAENPELPATGSIGWLARFAAASSLAAPLIQAEKLIGAIAVATGRRIEPEDDVWRLVVSIAESTPLEDSRRV